MTTEVERASFTMDGSRFKRFVKSVNRVDYGRAVQNYLYFIRRIDEVKYLDMFITDGHMLACEERAVEDEHGILPDKLALSRKFVDMLAGTIKEVYFERENGDLVLCAEGPKCDLRFKGEEDVRIPPVEHIREFQGREEEYAISFDADKLIRLSGALSGDRKYVDVGLVNVEDDDGFIVRRLIVLRGYGLDGSWGVLMPLEHPENKREKEYGKTGT